MHQSPSGLVFESKSGFLLYIRAVDTGAQADVAVDISLSEDRTLFHPESPDRDEGKLGTILL